MREDYKLNNLISNMESKANEGADEYNEVVFIVEEFPEINYVLAYRKNEYQPWVAAWDYNEEVKSWGQGHYFANFLDAVRYIQNKIDVVPFPRLEEIASKAIDGLIEDDPYEAEEYFRNEIEITFEEAEYFGIAETMDMIKGYEEEDDYYEE